MRLVVLLLLFSSQLAFGQVEKIQIFDFKSSTCDQEEGPSRLRTRIIKKELVGNILTVEIASVATCCVDFKPTISTRNGVLDIGFEETGTPCECTCCYEFIYEVKGIKDSNLKIKFRGKEIELSNEKFKTYPIKFEILNGDTVNYVDKYGLRQGKWVYLQDSLRKSEYLLMEDNIGFKRVKLYSNNKPSQEWIKEKIRFTSNNKEYFEYNDYNKYVEYFESGVKKMECHNNKNSNINLYREGKCKEWNEKGELIYEGVYRK